MRSVQAQYDPVVVVLSYLVAVFASYVALDLASSVSAASSRLSFNLWLIGGAIAMGAGIWSVP